MGTWSCLFQEETWMLRRKQCHDWSSLLKNQGTVPSRLGSSVWVRANAWSDKTVQSQMFASLRLSKGASLETSPRLWNSCRRWVASSSRIASTKSRVPCCTNIVTSSKLQFSSKSSWPWRIFRTLCTRSKQRSRCSTDSLPKSSSSITREYSNRHWSEWSLFHVCIQAESSHRNTRCSLVWNYPKKILCDGVAFRLCVAGPAPLCFVTKSKNIPTTLREFWSRSCDLNRALYPHWFVQIVLPLNVIEHTHICNSSLELSWRSTFICHHLFNFLKKKGCGVSWENPPVELHLMTWKVTEFLTCELCLQLPSNHSGTKFNPNTWESRNITFINCACTISMVIWTLRTSRFVNIRRNYSPSLVRCSTAHVQLFMNMPQTAWLIGNVISWFRSFLNFKLTFCNNSAFRTSSASFVGLWSNVRSNVANSSFAVTDHSEPNVALSASHVLGVPDDSVSVFSVSCTLNMLSCRTVSLPAVFSRDCASMLTADSHGVTSSLVCRGLFFHADDTICLVVLFDFHAGREIAHRPLFGCSTFSDGFCVQLRHVIVASQSRKKKKEP